MMIEQFELPESAADLSLDDVMVAVRGQMGADQERFRFVMDDSHPDFGLKVPTQQPAPFGQALLCVSCGSTHITGGFTKEGYENHCYTCGHRWVGDWPAPVITAPDKKDDK